MSTMTMEELERLHTAAVADRAEPFKYRAIQVSKAEADWLRACRDHFPAILTALDFCHGQVHFES